MKQKAITIILTLVVIIAAVGVLPVILTGSYNTVKLISLLAGGAILVILLLANYKTLSIDTKDVLILLFLGLVFASTCFSSNLKVSIIGEKNRYEGLLMFATYIIIYLCSKKYFQYKNIKIFLNIMFYVSVAIGILGIAQRHVDYVYLYPIFNHGICSTFGNSNFFGSYISMVLPVAATIFILTGSKKGFLLSLLMFFNLISSGTRSAWVAFAVIALLGLIYLIKQRNKVYFKRTIILLVCFIIIFVYLFNGFGIIQNNSTTKIKINQIKNDLKKATQTGFSNEMGSGRIEIWKMTLKLIAKKPILGCGVDNLKAGLIENCTDDIVAFANRANVLVDKAHNEYLQIAATIGIPALIVYLLFIGMILLPKMRKMLTEKTYLVITLTIISYLVQAFFNISTIGIAPLFWMILGLSDNEDFINRLSKIL
ncbi:MAG: O-antigen ligase family protein [Clostridia bacterium]